MNPRIRKTTDLDGFLSFTSKRKKVKRPRKDALINVMTEAIRLMMVKIINIDFLKRVSLFEKRTVLIIDVIIII